MDDTLSPGSKKPEPGGPATAVEVLQILQALADPVRLDIVRRLRAAGEDQRCGVLYDELPKSTASYHFRVLREGGVIEQYDCNGRRFNRLREQEIQQLTPGLLDAVFGEAP